MSSTLKLNNVQVGQSGTATNNFTLYQPTVPDGTVRLGVGNSGATTSDVITATSGGNVGIGTSSPTARLTVVTGAAGNNEGEIRLSENATYYAGLRRVNATDEFRIGSYGPSQNLTFYTVSSERARIDSSGNFMVGATSSSSRAYVVTPNNQWAVYSEATSSSLTAGCLALVAARNTTNNTYKAMVYYNSGAGADRFYVTDGGAVYGTGAYNQISDARLKENVRPLELGLAQVMALQPRRYDWKEGKGANTKDAVGFVAQEVETALPHAVTEWTNSQGDQTTYKAVSMDSMVPVLVKAIQELTAKLDAAEARIAALEAK